MTSAVEKCGECRDWHQPGPCYPTDTERVRDQGWRLYRATRTTTFKSADKEEKGQQ